MRASSAAPGAGAGSFMSWASLSGDVGTPCGSWVDGACGRRGVASWPPPKPNRSLWSAQRAEDGLGGADRLLPGGKGGDWSEARPARAGYELGSPRGPGRKRRRRRRADGDRGPTRDRQDRADGRGEVKGQRGRDAGAQCARLGARALVLLRRRAPALRAAARLAIAGGARADALDRRSGAGRAALQPGAVQRLGRRGPTRRWRRCTASTG